MQGSAAGLFHPLIPRRSHIVKPPTGSGTKRAGTRGKRKMGGQPGHAKHERPPFTPEQLDGTWDYTLRACPNCGGEVKKAQVAPRIVQQVELVEKPVRVDEHRALACWCPRCRQVVSRLRSKPRGTGMSISPVVAPPSRSRRPPSSRDSPSCRLGNP